MTFIKTQQYQINFFLIYNLLFIINLTENIKSKIIR
jgi:hypothetical protein